MSLRDQERAILRAKKAALRRVEEKRQKDVQESKKSQDWIELLGQCEGSIAYARSQEAAQRVRILCKGGIPPHLRGKVWPMLIGKDEEINYEEFSVLREKAEDLRRSSGLGVTREGLGNAWSIQSQVTSTAPSSYTKFEDEQDEQDEQDGSAGSAGSAGGA